MLNTATNVVIALVMSPFIVHEVGLAAFGYWSVLLAILQYVQIADGSLPTVTIRYVARSLGDGDLIALREAVATTLLSLSVIAALIIACALVVPAVIPASVSSGLPHGWAGAATWAGVALGVTILASGLGAVTRGSERWDLDAGIWILSNVVTAIATVVLLLSGGGLASLGLAVALGSVFVVAGYGWYAATSSALGRRGFRPNREIFRELRRQGFALQIVALVGATNAQADRLMLLPFAPLSFIGAYALGARVAVSLRAFPLGAFGPLLARLARTRSEGMEPFRALYQTALWVTTAYAAPALLGVYFACFPAVLAWLGPSFTISAGGAVLLGAGYAVNIVTGPGTLAALAAGRPELDRDYCLLGLVLNVSLSVALGIAFGAWGVIAATTLGLGLSSAWLVTRVDKFLGLAIGRAIMTAPTVLQTLAGILAIGGLTIGVTLGEAPLARWENVLIGCASGALVLLWVARAGLRRGSQSGRRTWFPQPFPSRRAPAEKRFVAYTCPQRAVRSAHSEHPAPNGPPVPNDSPAEIRTAADIPPLTLTQVPARKRRRGIG